MSLHVRSSRFRQLARIHEAMGQPKNILESLNRQVMMDKFVAVEIQGKDKESSVVSYLSTLKHFLKYMSAYVKPLPEEVRM